MEFPRRLTLGERVLAAALLAAALSVAWLESRSPAAAAVRARAPMTAWVALESPSYEVPRLFLLFLSPAKGTADLIYAPETTVISGKTYTLTKVYGVSRRRGASRRDAAKAMADALEPLVTPSLPGGAAPLYFYYDTGTADGSVEAPLWGLRWLDRRVRGYGLWREVGLQFVGRGHGFGLDGFEKLRLGVELHSLDDDKSRAGYLPKPEELSRYFAGLAGGSAQAEPGEPRDNFLPSVEVLNASARPGAAARITKKLRARGIDVLSEGNAPARSFTIVYDRVGRPEVAAHVRRLLSCDTADVLTYVDRTRAVDASVLLGDDCSGRE